ncbi:hypothetical protein Hypma_004378 [Hypsizygus marmoreus]|uniref:Uncharacterized protein n=1 Tax=Hypsizygus marmoreus TaxID=39966 RepID=A0A369JY60_HYPMA|nr:hypothetical protein Hypma_004378 [Hypsizygus marmoreus]
MDLNVIAALPVDVLLDIFRTSIRDIDAPSTWPVLLSHVCRPWRDIIENTPTLWTVIRIDEQLDTNTIRFHNTLRCVEHFLHLSLELPLRISAKIISFDFHSDAVDYKDPYLGNLCNFRDCIKFLSNMLGQHASRIKALDIVCDEPDTLMNLQVGFHHMAMPQLERLSLYDTYDDQVFDEEGMEEIPAFPVLSRPQSFTGDAAAALYSALTTVRLSGIAIDWTQFCATSLTSLEISNLAYDVRPSGTALRRILSANSRLCQLSLDGSLGQDTDANDWTQEPLVLSNVWKLDLGFCTAMELIPFLRVVQAPNLTSLSLRDIMRGSISISLNSDLLFDCDIPELLELITERLPLDRLLKLTLRHIMFSPPVATGDPSHNGSRYMPNSAQYPIHTAGFNFFSRMTSLLSLEMINPDLVSLLTLNYIPIPSMCPQNTRGAPTPMPTPSLAFLHLADTPFSILYTFLRCRLWTYRSLHRLDTIMLSMPAGWYEKFGLDLSPLAREVQAFDIILCPELGEMLAEL